MSWKKLMIEQNIHDRDFCYAYSDELPEDQAEILRVLSKSNDVALFYDGRYSNIYYPWDLFYWGEGILPPFDNVCNYSWDTAVEFKYIHETYADDIYCQRVMDVVKKFPCTRLSFETLEKLLEYAKGI